MSFGESVRKSMDSDLINQDPRDEDLPDKLPKGKYTVEIDEATAFTSHGGDEYAKVILSIIEGPVEGRFQHFMNFKNEVGKSIAAEALATYGVDWTTVDTITDLDLQMGQLRGTKAELSVSYKDGWLNIKVHGSRPVQPMSDIPTEPSGFERTPEQQASFAAAAQKFGDEPAF